MLLAKRLGAQAVLVHAAWEPVIANLRGVGGFALLAVTPETISSSAQPSQLHAWCWRPEQQQEQYLRTQQRRASGWPGVQQQHHCDRRLRMPGAVHGGQPHGLARSHAALALPRTGGSARGARGGVGSSDACSMVQVRAHAGPPSQSTHGDRRGQGGGQSRGGAVDVKRMIANEDIRAPVVRLVLADGSHRCGSMQVGVWLLPSRKFGVRACVRAESEGGLPPTIGTAGQRPLCPQSV
jgi:hypothetical protein